MTTYTFYDHIPAQAKYIREEVFVKEQGFHHEFDEIDSRAIHLVIFVEGQAAGTARMFLEQEGDTAFTVGRVAVLPQYRGLHLGNQMLALLEEKARELGIQRIALSAQCRVQPFYEKNGYIAMGEVYGRILPPHPYGKGAVTAPG